MDRSGGGRPFRLFVYGTLQPQAGTRMGDWIAERLASAEPATVPGRLFAIRGGNGWFPALVPGGSECGTSSVRGTLCRLHLASGELSRLDRYEGREYRRGAVRVRREDGRLQAAQAYLWRIPLPQGSPAIVHGDFLEWLRAVRQEAFSTLRNGS